MNFFQLSLLNLFHFSNNVIRTTSESSSSSSSEEDSPSFEDQIKNLRLYIKEDSTQEVKLNIALESYLEWRKKSDEDLLSYTKSHVE